MLKQFIGPLGRLLLMAALAIPGIASAQATLLSQKKPVVASSQEASFVPASAVDGVATTRWSSAFSDPQWIYVDLGSVSNISRVVLSWEAAYGKGYQIQVSNDATNWTTAYSTTTGDGGTDDITLSATGRYVRMYGTVRATAYGYSLYEFQVYGADPVLATAGAVASSKEGTLAAQYAVDSNTGTRWGSAFTDAEWIYVDLGASAKVSRVVLNWENAYAKAYQLQTSSDAVNWTTVYSTTTGDGGIDDIALANATGRYVRMNGVTRATVYGYSLWEFQVYGSGGSASSQSSQSSVSSSVVSSSSKPSSSSTSSSSVKSSSSSSSSSSKSSTSSTSSALAQAYPKKVFFIGNSFTYYGPVPKLVESIARYNGFADVSIDYRAIASATLNQHRNDTAADGAPARLQAGWDAVVLQDQSTRPTDSGDPLGFYDDATWFYDYIKTINSNTRVYLYETWAWRYDSSQYPTPFATPAQMQAELRYHYNEAATHYITSHSKFAPTPAVPVAPVGDAWELDLQNGEADGRLHDPDSHHANTLGQYLNALVIYSTIFDRASQGTIPLGGITEAQAAHLQEIADSTTHKQGVGIDKSAPTPIATGSSFLIDIGPLSTSGWVSLTNNATAAHIPSATGQASSVNVTVWGFQGEQTGGALTNSFGWPDTVSRDSLWVGSNNTHADGLLNEGRVALRGLPAGNYKLEIFGSRDGNDGGLGRVTRFTVGSQFADLDTSDNSSRTAVLNVSPDANGVILLKVGVSPDSLSRLGYLGVIKVTKL